MSNNEQLDQLPQGLVFRHSLQGHSRSISKIAWSPNGKMLASGSRDKSVYLWNVGLGQSFNQLVGHSGTVHSVAWSPSGNLLASASSDSTIRIWQARSGELVATFKQFLDVYSLAWSHNGEQVVVGTLNGVSLLHISTRQSNPLPTPRNSVCHSVAWSPDGRIIAAGLDYSVLFFDSATRKHIGSAVGHYGTVYCLTWTIDGETLISGSSDRTIQLWNTKNGRSIGVLEGHTKSIMSTSLSFDGRLLASKSLDNTVRLWRTDIWQCIATIDEQAASSPARTSLSFSPKAPILATLGDNDCTIRLWDLNFNTLLGLKTSSENIYYKNAKIVLLGDSGVGKSGLSLALTGQEFRPTESTHGRRVLMFDYQEISLEGEREENRETLLWDLAGQPGYRLIHQLHLKEIAVAVVVFDARSETDPFSGVHHWDRALRQSQRLQGPSALPMKKFLVAARSDRGGVPVSRARIETLKADLGFDAFFETSAKEGWDISTLSEQLKNSIDWMSLPKFSSTEFLQRIKDFLLGEKAANRLLSTPDDLYRIFLKTTEDKDSESLRLKFDTCIGQLESRDLIKTLSFGNLVLLQPEFLDGYASALVNAARDEPDGEGSIAEEDVRLGRFKMPEDERIKDKEQEKLLLLSTIEDLLRHEIALREQADEGAYLIFPSQFTREKVDLSTPKGKSLIFEFDGPIATIYTTLVVRLSHSGFFKKKELWKNAAEYTTSVGGTYGISLRHLGEGHGEITLFFNNWANEGTQLLFEEYTLTHLQRKALPESITRRKIYVCPDCQTPILDLAVTRRKERGFDWIICNVCGNTKVSLKDYTEQMKQTGTNVVAKLDQKADAQREIEVGVTIRSGEIITSIKHLENLLKVHRDRMNVLEEQQARYGIDTPPHIVNEIADLQKKIIEVQEKIRVLSEQS